MGNEDSQERGEGESTPKGGFGAGRKDEGRKDQGRPWRARRGSLGGLRNSGEC